MKKAIRKHEEETPSQPSGLLNEAVTMIEKTVKYGYSKISLQACLSYEKKREI